MLVRAINGATKVDDNVALEVAITGARLDAKWGQREDWFLERAFLAKENGLAKRGKQMMFVSF